MTDQSSENEISSAETVPAEIKSNFVRACSAGARRISIGLSIETGVRTSSYSPFMAPVDIELSESRLALIVSAPEGFLPNSGERIRLTVAIEGVRVERLLLPMYSGGSQIVVWPSALSSNDVKLEVLPNDARLRALVRTLTAGTDDEAEAILPLISSIVRQIAIKTDVDPWEAMLTALLSIRFPDRISGITPDMADTLVASAPWASDVHVIQARQHLYLADVTTSGAQKMSSALRKLRSAQARGAPYFSYSNQLFAQLIEGLDAILSKSGPAKLSKQASRIHASWMRNQSLQSGAGASYSWLRRDKAQKADGISPADRSSSGKLGRDSTLLFAGLIADGLILFDPRQNHRPPKHPGVAVRMPMEFGGEPESCPAMLRKPGPINDPNLGRFGGRSASAGYRLHVRFAGDPNAAVIPITISIELDQGVAFRPCNFAWFCLHPTFPWRWVKVMFGNDRAVFSVMVWGGFTVGAWLPEAGVELECDISKVPNAPRVIELL